MKRLPVGRMLVAAAAGATAVAAYALVVEPRWLQVTHTHIYFPTLPPALAGLRIALLTDLHAGFGTSLEFVRRVCRRTQALQPDLIALTGDFVADDAPSFAPVLDVLATLKAPLGVYAVPGNHDYRVGIQRWHEEVTPGPPIVDLTNDAVVQIHRGARLCIAGVDDFSKGTPRLDRLPPPEARDFTILLAHNPDQAEHLCQPQIQVDLVLSGHTHGGQVRLPWLGALRNPARHAELYEQGLQRRPWATVYVSRGLGEVDMPLRFLARPEIALLHLMGPPTPLRTEAATP